MSKYEKNKLQLPDLDEFASSGNSFLKDIAAKASVYNLSVNQVAAAQRAWAAIKADKEAGVVRANPWDENVKRFPEMATPHFDIFMSNSENEFLHDLYSKARKWTLSDKQMEAFRNAYLREQDFTTPPDMQAFLLMGRAVSLAMQSEWLHGEISMAASRGSVKTRAYQKLVEGSHKFRKSIFGHVFDTDIRAAKYYISKLEGKF